MKLSNYFYKVGDTNYGDRIGVSELDSRDCMTPQYIDMFYNELGSIKLVGKTALLYVGGVGIAASECRRVNETVVGSVGINDNVLVIKTTQAYMLHKYAGLLVRNNNIVYASISSTTCASSLHSLYEAERLLSSEVDNVVVIAEEKTSSETLRIFYEHDIPLIVGEGFACVVLTNEVDGIQVTDTKWAYEYNRNPFAVTASGYESVYTACDVVKGHKTGTAVNDKAEEEAFGEVVGYKGTIGHCQGASGLIELCMVADDEALSGRVLCVASGLGNWYGSCILRK